MQNTIGRPKDLEKRARILQAAKVIFLKSGYHGASMNQIAREADVTKLTVYNHFQDKESLFICAIQETCTECMAEQQFCLNAESDFLQVFFNACKCVLNIIYLPEAIKLKYVLFELGAEKNPLAERFFNASYRYLSDALADFFQQAAALHFIRTDDCIRQTELVLTLLLGMRHHQVLLGIQDVPDSTEIHQIIYNTIEIFMLKYKV